MHTPPRRLALLCSSPRLLQPFLDNRALRDELRVEIPVAILIQPSMRLSDRCRDLRGTLIRRARINRTTPWLQLFHHFAFRRISRRGPPESAKSVAATLGAGRRLIEVRSANDPAVAAALREERCALGLVMGSDVLSRRTLEALGAPLYNVHLSDPAFVRGMPPVFWEILDGHDSIRLTLHLVTADLDAGPLVAQRDVPIAWHRTLAGTLAGTLDRCGPEVAALLADGLPGILDGTAKPRAFDRGTLRTTPTIRQMLMARRICEQRAREPREAASIGPN